MNIETRLLEEKIDQRGNLVEIFKGSHLGKNEWGQVYLFSLNPGAVRGNHYHLTKNEWFFLIAGQVELILFDTVSQEKLTKVLSESNPELVHIPARFIHTFRNSCINKAQILAYIDQEFDPDFPDTYHFSLI